MRTTAKALETLFPGTRHRIIAAVFMEPERWWSLGDLGVELAMPALGLRREMTALCGGGILLRKRLSRRTCFRPDPACPFFTELQAMAAKCATVEKRDRCETILVVEDEPATLKISRILLESWGYRVIEANSPLEAMDLFERNAQDIRLVLTDVVMPGMTGPELGELLKARKPELKLLYMSGYHNERFLHENEAFLPKPFNPAGLARKIREVLDK